MGVNMNQLQRTEALQRHLKGETMTHSERFALNQWLSDYPEKMSYDEILDWLRADVDEENLCTWFVLEYLPASEVIQIIEDTRKAFERAVNEILKEKQ